MELAPTMAERHNRLGCPAILPAEIWLENRHAAKVFRSAEKAIKEIVPANAKRAHGHGIEVKRGRGGSLLIGETKQ